MSEAKKAGCQIRFELLYRHRGATRTRFSALTAPVCCVLLNHNATAFLNRKALPTNAVKAEKSSTLNAGILSFIKTEDAGGLAPVKDDNAEKGQKIKFKACLRGSPMLKARHQLGDEMFDEIGEKEGWYIRQYLPLLNTQIPREDDWHRFTVNKSAEAVTLQDILEEVKEPC